MPAPDNPGRPSPPGTVRRPGTDIDVPVKHFADAKAEYLPVEDQAVIALADAAWLAYHENPTPESRRAWQEAKTTLRERRRFWRAVGEATGARRGVLIINHTGDGEV